MKEKKDELIKAYSKIEEKDPYGILEFDERYIPLEVETPLKISNIYEILGCD